MKRTVVVLLAFALTGCATAVGTILSPPVKGARLITIRSRAENTQALVFVHGVIGDPTITWTNKNGTYWPELVAKQFENLNVFVFGYYTPPATPAPTIVQLAAQLTAALQANGVLPTRYNGTHERLYFVAHSMGNLIVRQALQARTAYRYVEVPLLLSIASPSVGSEVATIAKNFSNNPTLASMGEAPLNDFLQSLNATWIDDHPRTEIACAFETLPWKGLKIVVTELSATAECTRQMPFPVTADHENSVKPSGPDDEVHRWLKLQLVAPWRPKGPRNIVIMDNPHVTYDKQRFESEGKMNAHVIQEVLRASGLDGDVAPVETRWDQADTNNIIAKEPELVIIHYSAFFGVPQTPGDFELVLTRFLKDVLTRTRARVILYSRWRPSELREFSMYYWSKYWSPHSGLPRDEADRAWRRLRFFDIRRVQNSKDPRLNDRPVEEALVALVNQALQIE
jgi:hypothetical protein